MSNNWIASLTDEQLDKEIADRKAKIKKIPPLFSVIDGTVQKELKELEIEANKRKRNRTSALYNDEKQGKIEE